MKFDRQIAVRALIWLALITMLAISVVFAVPVGMGVGAGGWLSGTIFMAAGMIGPTALFIAAQHAWPWPVDFDPDWKRKTMGAAAIAAVDCAILVLMALSVPN